MGGLLLKDFRNIQKQMIWYLSLIVIFALLSIAMQNISFASSIGFLVTISVPLTTFAYDEKDHWFKFISASGMNCNIVVLEKYLLGLIFSLISFIIYWGVLGLSLEGRMYLSDLVAPASMQIIMLSLILPLIFRYGVERGRTYSILILVGSLLLWIGFLTLFIDVCKFSDFLISGALMGISVLFLIVSYRLSVYIFRRKEY